MAVAKKLYELQPSKDFWTKAYLSFKLNSLRWFLTDNGKAFLKLEHKRQRFDIKPKTQYTLDESKIGKDKKVTRKVKSIKDFLNAKD